MKGSAKASSGGGGGDSDINSSCDNGDETARRQPNSDGDGRRWTVQRQRDGNNGDGRRAATTMDGTMATR